MATGNTVKTQPIDNGGEIRQQSRQRHRRPEVATALPRIHPTDAPACTKCFAQSSQSLIYKNQNFRDITYATEYQMPQNRIDKIFMYQYASSLKIQN